MFFLAHNLDRSWMTDAGIFFFLVSLFITAVAVGEGCREMRFCRLHRALCTPPSLGASLFRMPIRLPRG